MKKLILITAIAMVFTSCTKETAELLECETENIAYVDLNNADDEPYYMYMDDVLIMTIGAYEHIDDYEFTAGYHEFRFVEVNAIISNVDEFDGNYNTCSHASLIFGDGDIFRFSQK